MRNTSGGQKQHKKRKHRPTTPPVKSRIAQRLEKIRTGRTYLWDDDSDEDTLDEQPRKKSSRTAHVTFLDSDDERPSTPPQRPLRKTPTSKKKASHQQNEADTCLICSILSQLSSYNCCSAHLSLLKAATPHRHHAVRSRGSSEKVIVARMSEDDIQQYLEPTPRKTPKSSKPRSSRAAIPPLASTIVVGTSISPDVNNATVTSTSSPTKMTTSSDVEPKRSARKTSDDCQVEHPWIDISEETDAALEHVLSQVELAAESPLEYTPTAARRTNTEVMAARLPKIPLKQGRFRNGKPIGKSPTDVTSANEYRPRVDAQTSPPPPATASSPPENIPEPSEQEAGFRLIVPNAADMAADNNENAVVDLNANLSDDVQQSSSVTMKDKATPSRQSTILTPDGSRVRISRPALIHNRRSPSIGVLRRTSTDVTPVAPNAEP